MLLSAFKRCVLTRLEEVKQSIAELRKAQALLTSKVDHIITTGGGRESGLHEEMPNDIVLPLKSPSELKVSIKRFKIRK